MVKKKYYKYIYLTKVCQEKGVKCVWYKSLSKWFLIVSGKTDPPATSSKDS